MPPTPEFLADRYREATSAARVMWARPYDLKLHRWLHRLTDADAGAVGRRRQADPGRAGRGLGGAHPGAEVKRLPGVGHLVFEEAPEACEIVASFVEARTRARAAS